MELKMPSRIRWDFVRWVIETVGYHDHVTDEDRERSTYRDSLLLKAVEKDDITTTDGLLPIVGYSHRSFIRACERGCRPIVGIFLSHPRCSPSSGRNAALKAAQSHHHRDIVRAIKAHPRFIRKI